MADETRVRDVPSLSLRGHSRPTAVRGGTRHAGLRAGIPGRREQARLPDQSDDGTRRVVPERRGDWLAAVLDISIDTDKTIHSALHRIVTCSHRMARDAACTRIGKSSWLAYCSSYTSSRRMGRLENPPPVSWLGAVPRHSSHILQQLLQRRLVLIPLRVSFQTAANQYRCSSGAKGDAEIGRGMFASRGRTTHLGIRATATSTDSGRRYMIWACSNLLRKPGCASSALRRVSNHVLNEIISSRVSKAPLPRGPMSKRRCKQTGHTHVRILATTSPEELANSPTYSRELLYTLRKRSAQVAGWRDVSTQLREKQSLVTHLLSGGGGAPGAVLAAASSVWTSVKVRASPSAKSACRLYQSQSLRSRTRKGSLCHAPPNWSLVASSSGIWTRVSNNTAVLSVRDESRWTGHSRLCAVSEMVQRRACDPVRALLMAGSR
jgi:hypothetical protein